MQESRKLLIVDIKKNFKSVSDYQIFNVLELQFNTFI